MAYASIDELKRLLNKQDADAVELEAMQRCLDAAASEIDWELDYTVDTPAPTPPPALVISVNLDRAVEHWKQSYAPFGVLPTAGDLGPIVTARNSWYRHHLKLAPLKRAAGIA